MDDSLSKALKERDELIARLEKIDRFVKAYRDLYGTEVEHIEFPSEGVNSGDGDPNADRPARRGPRINPMRVADMAARIILDEGRPLTRGELVDEIKRRDVTLPTKDEARYVGTILWRQGDRFVNLRGVGYWLAKKPYPPAGYDPAVEARAEELSEEKIKAAGEDAEAEGFL